MKEIIREIEKYKHNRVGISTIEFNYYSVIFLKCGKTPLNFNYIIDTVLKKEIQ